MALTDSLTYAIAFPCEALRPYVSHFWCSQWPDGVQNNFHYHSIANTCTEFAFAFASDTQKKNPVFASVQGHSDSYRQLEIRGVSGIFGVSIYSYAIPFFFNFSAADLRNQLVDVCDIVKGETGVLIEQLAKCCDFNERIAAMSRYLQQKFDESTRADLPMLYAINRIRKMQGQVNIANLANDVALSQKQFERRFKQFSGFNPKLYSTILRFESSLAQRHLAGSTSLALDLGYYDQAHFINDFKRFSGFTPGKYVPIS